MAAQVEPQKSPPSIPLGQFRVLEELGKGGFGIVHKAELAGINKPFAIKFLDPHPFQKDPETARKRFLQEAHILFDLKHEHIISIHGVGETDGRPYILMEYFAGFNLQDARTIKPNPPLMDVLQFIRRIALGLSYAHKKKVIHRDIKPTNLMTLKGDARILDFGLAKLLDPNHDPITRSSGGVFGDAFSAPEFLEDPKSIDPRCDIYSLGACWYWLLTGATPRGVNWEAKMRHVPGMTQAYQSVIIRTLDQVDARYSTADELIEELDCLQNASTPRSATPSVSDEEALILGIIANTSFMDGYAISQFALEREIGHIIIRFELMMCLKRLIANQYVDRKVEFDINGTPDASYVILEKGDAWINANSDRVSKLLRELEPPPAEAKQDVLF